MIAGNLKALPGLSLWTWPVISVIFLLHTCDSVEWTGSFCTQSTCNYPNERSIRFFILGDMGGQDRHPYTTPIQMEVARSINNASTILRPVFYLSTGDNFYESGVKSVKDKRFDATFDSVYTYGKKENIPWFITIGNHDYYGNLQALIDYSKVNPRWICPALYYSFRYSFGSERGQQPELTTVEIFILDTIMLCGDIIIGGWNPWTREYIKPSDRPQGPKNVTAMEEALRWLENGLKKSTANYLFVVGHYPVYSTGKHGDTKLLRDRLSDLLMKYKVNAYLGGHDHQIQHLKMEGPDGWTVHHVISGAASKVDKRQSSPEKSGGNSRLTSMFAYPGLKESSPKGGYVYAEIRQDEAIFDFYKGDGEHLYEFASGRR